MLLRLGDNPDESDDGDMVWAHRSTGSIGGTVNGGLGCVVESWWRNHVLGVGDIPVNLSVKNGRWRVGRGRLCTMGKSPKPAGSWRVMLPDFVPGNDRGKALRAASLKLVEDGGLVVASGHEVFWESSPR